MRRNPEVVVDFTEPLDVKVESDSNFKNLKDHIESKKAEQEAKKVKEEALNELSSQ